MKNSKGVNYKTKNKIKKQHYISYEWWKIRKFEKKNTKNIGRENNLPISMSVKILYKPKKEMMR